MKALWKRLASVAIVSLALGFGLSQVFCQLKRNNLEAECDRLYEMTVLSHAFTTMAVLNRLDAEQTLAAVDVLEVSLEGNVFVLERLAETMVLELDTKERLAVLNAFLEARESRLE